MSHVGAAVDPNPARTTAPALAWLAIFVPFVVTVLANGPAGGLIAHGAYHLVYVAVIGLAVLTLLNWRSVGTSRAARRLILAIVILQGIAVIGHVGEWASTLSDGRYHEPGVGTIKGDESLHTAFANVTVPALVLSIVLLIATTVIVWRQRTASRPAL